MMSSKKSGLWIVAAMGVVLALGQSAQAQSWSFGVISDTQWTVADDGYNPNTVAANIIKNVDQQFINKGVKLVVAVGDMVDTGSQVNDYTRALYAQDLYNNGIGFYPLRGNHEAANGSYTGSGADYLHAYPQIVPGATAGLNNATPADITTALIPANDLANNAPAVNTGSTFTVGTNFSAPTTVNATTGGVSYAFDYNNATFVMLDQFQSPDYYTSYIPAQQDWIDSTLSSRPANTQAFVFTHKNILGGNHKDNMFGGQINSSDPGDGYGIDPNTLSAADQTALATKQANESNFIASMQANNVKYVISGHDHHHYDSVVTSPDGASQVHQLITASDSSKFYTPGNPVSGNDAPVEQDLGRVGYYIFTVDGPRVTIDYYADSTGGGYYGANGGTFNFVKRSTTGYSLNGKEKLVAQGGSYALSDDTTLAATLETGFKGTSMAILGGTNGSSVKTNYGKATEKDVNTGWAAGKAGMASDILTLWGLTDVGADHTEAFALSMSFDSNGLSTDQLRSGLVALMSQGADGNWVNAVDLNVGGTKSFVFGAWDAADGLGTYGIDTSTGTAWAVLNHDSTFAVVPEPATLALLAFGGAAALLRRRRQIS